MSGLEELMFSRQPAAVTERLRRACVGIAGAGGLGSVVAEILARAGVGRLVIVDFDVVEPSNLNRQRYGVAQLGMPKVQALSDNIMAFTPFTQVVAIRERVTFENCGTLFAGCAIIAECLDGAADKASLVSGILKSMPQAAVVAVSGIAGIADGDSIGTHMISSRFFMVGDLCSDAADGAGLFASRVGIAAAKQAHVTLRILSGDIR